VTAIRTEPHSTVAELPPKKERLLSLDVFRGITIAGMLLVNDPGTWSAIYPPLEHAEWNGWTPTDLIFPFFLFIVGITTYLSINSRRAHGADDGAIIKQIIRRGLIIYLLGFLMALSPGYQWGDITGFAHPSAWDRVLMRWEHVRIMGVLARIGIVYIIAALICYKTTMKQQVVIIACILYGYWFAMTLLPVPGTGGTLGAALIGTKDQNLAAWLDRKILGVNHIWVGGVTFDPEGPMSTIPAIATAMLGYLCGRWIGTVRPLLEKMSGLFAVGSIGMMLGLMWNWSFPINKSLWTSSYVLFTAGMACVILAACMWIIDYHNIRGWTKPWVIFGVNPIVAFVGSGMLARLIYTLWTVNYQGKPTSVQQVIYKTAFASWLPPRLASLGFAVVFVLLWYFILAVLYRKKIFLKV
jgi:predicted acyltransferase